MLHRQSKNRVESRRGSNVGGLITAGVLAGVVSVPALAGPSGEQVVYGEARFQRSGTTTTITTSNRAIIHYEAFNLNANETVRFIQPDAASRVLNRIHGGAPSVLDGAIFANGNVYFVNPAGIFFGQNSVVNVGGIFAAAGNITNQDFLSNVNRFTDLTGAVINSGEIYATKEAHLIGRRVANFGQIIAPDGLVTMSAGKDVLLGQRGGKVFARISGDVSANGAIGVENRGIIDAGSGQVIAGVGDHFAMALYDTSVIRGSSVRIAGGASSVVKVGGSVDASNNAGRGGDIEVLGGRVALLDADLNASGTAGGGQINVGGDYQGIGDRLRSELTYVDAGSSISVDATRSGDAGTAIVWSDGATIFRGDISGKGAGKGGFAEVSSLGFLDFNGSFDLRGSLGNGTLLLDPKDIIITATDLGGANDIIDVDTFAVDSSATTFIFDDLLSSWLNGGVAGDVMLKANNDIVFNPFSSVIQNAGETSSLQLFAGRRIVFAPNSSLFMGGGSITGIANAVDQAGFVAADRDAGVGTIIFALGSQIQVANAGQSADFSVVGGAGTPGDIIVLGELSAPTITFNALDATSEILIFDDANIATDQFGLGSDVTLAAGERVRFLRSPGNTGDWSFGSLDVTSPETRFGFRSTGVTATTGMLSFTSTGAGLFTDSSGLFTFTGPTELMTDYRSTGDVLFAGTLALESAITAPGSVTFQDAVTLTDDSSVTLTAAGDVLFSGTVEGTTATQDDLTLNLGGFGDATFQDQIGQFAFQLGNITVNGLTGTLSFNGFTFANSVTVGGGAGTVNLGDGDDLLALQGANTNGNGLELNVAQVNLRGNVITPTGAVLINGPMNVMGDRSIGTLNANGTITLGSVVLDAAAGNTNLTLNTFAGADISVADGAGQSVTRDTGIVNFADLNINSFGGDVTIGNVLSSADTEDNVLRIFDINAGAGTVNFTGGRYIANTMNFTGGVFTVASDSNFGDLTGGSATSEVQSISFNGGELRLNGNDTLQLAALDSIGGSISIDNAVALGADANLDLETSDNNASLVTLGTIGNNIGGALNRINLTSFDATFNGAVFADALFLDPTNNTIILGDMFPFGMSITDADIANLNTGEIGTLFLGFDDPSTFGSYAGVTVFDTANFTSIDQIEVFGSASVSDGETATRNINFYGPTLLTNNSILTANGGSAIRFFDDVTAFNNATINAIDGIVSFVNDDPTVPRLGRGALAEIGASIDADLAGGDLTINAGDTGVVTLFDVGATRQLTALNVNSGQIDFRGTRYNAVSQFFTFDTANMRGDLNGLAGSTINFAGTDAMSPVQNVTFNDLNGGDNAQIRITNGLTLNVDIAENFTSQAAVVGLGAGDQNLIVNADSIRFERAIGTANAAGRLGTVALTSDSIETASVFTTGNQTFSLLDNMNPGVLMFTGNDYNTSGSASITVNGFDADILRLNPMMGGVAIATANGGTVNYNLMTVDVNGSTLITNAGNAGTIDFADGIMIGGGAQTYFAGAMNFRGGAFLQSTGVNETISFIGGSVNLGTNTAGNLSLLTLGDGAGVSFGNTQIVLSGNDLSATTIGANSGIILANTIGTGTETVRLVANGQTVINGIGGAGISTLDIETNTLSIDALTMADLVFINTFDKLPGRNISVGDDASLIPGTLNISNASLANLAPVAGGTNTLMIGDPIYDGQILIGDATINRDVTFETGPMGLIDLASTGLNGTGGLTSIIMTAPEIRLGGAIQSGAGIFSLALNGPVNVSGNADIDTNGGDVTFGDAINGLLAGGGFLDVNTAGGAITMREDLGVIGAARSLGQLSLIGSPTLRLVGATTTGDQFFQTSGGSIILLDGATFNALDNAAITFANDTVAEGDAAATSGANGSVTFTGLLDGAGSSAQTVTLMTGAGGQVNLAQVGGPAGLGSLIVNTTTANLSGNLTLLQNLNLTADQTLLNGDQIMSAQAITLATDIDSNGAAASLTLENAIDTLIQGRLGGNSPLASFTSSDVGTTTLTGGVFSNGQALFRNNLAVSGGATIQTFGTGGTDGIRFLGTVDGVTAGADSLTLIVDRSLGQLVIDPVTGTPVPNANVPLIELFGNVGSNIVLGTLGLNFGQDVNGNAIDGRGFVPANATIVLGDSDAFFAGGTTTNILFNVDNLFMGAREKMVALGSLSANGINARLSDIATLNDLTVNYNAVTVFLREAGDVFDPTNSLVAQDTGTDFVSGGSMQFGNIVALESIGANPQFSLPGGDPSIQSSAGFFLFKSLDTPIQNLVSFGETVLDVRADGPTNTNVSEALAGAIPQEQQAEPVVTDVPLSQLALDALNDLGIVIKQPTENLYLVDLPDDIAETSGTSRISRRRLEPTLVSTLVADYDSALKESVSAPQIAAADETEETQTISVIRRDTEIKEILDEAWAAAFPGADQKGDATEFYAFVESNTDRFGNALVEISRLREVVLSARVLGLTEREVGAVKTKMYTMMQPNMGPRAFHELIDATPAVVLGVR